MKETRLQRISRLKGRKAELLGQIKALQDSTVRNLEHKVDMLMAQLARVEAKIKELKEVKNDSRSIPK